MVIKHNSKVKIFHFDFFEAIRHESYDVTNCTYLVKILNSRPTPAVTFITPPVKQHIALSSCIVAI